MSDRCRVCDAAYPSSKWRRNLFGDDLSSLSSLNKILRAIAVSKGDGRSSTICSSCYNKIAKVRRLETEVESLQVWIRQAFAKTSSRFVPASREPASGTIVGEKRRINYSPVGKPTSKRFNPSRSPLSPQRSTLKLNLAYHFSMSSSPYFLVFLVLFNASSQGLSFRKEHFTMHR